MLPNDERCALSTRQIATCLRNGLCPHTRCLGVFPADYSPAIDDDDDKVHHVAWVMNTAPSDHPGMHWVAYYHNSSSRRKPEFFDSVGLAPDTYGLPSGEMVAPREGLQSLDSNVCGQYCVFYLCQRSRGLSPSQVISVLKSLSSTNVNERERLLIDYCAALSRRSMHSSCSDCNQCCTSPRCFCTTTNPLHH